MVGAYVGGLIQDEEDGAAPRHLMCDIFGGLVAAGLTIREVRGAPQHLWQSPDAQPGTWAHMATFVQQYFTIVAQKDVRPL